MGWERGGRVSRGWRLCVRNGPVVSPNLNAFVERFIQTIQQECLDHVVMVGEKHLDRIVTSFVRFYHELRPHQSLENRPPTAHLGLGTSTNGPDSAFGRQRIRNCRSDADDSVCLSVVACMLCVNEVQSGRTLRPRPGRSLCRVCRRDQSSPVPPSICSRTSRCPRSFR